MAYVGWFFGVVGIAAFLCGAVLLIAAIKLLKTASNVGKVIGALMLIVSLGSLGIALTIWGSFE